MSEQPKQDAKMRYCWYCGDELGVIENKHYDRMDTCGKTECERARRQADQDEHDELHEKLDRDLGWGW
jgi:hypothetical protein